MHGSKSKSHSNRFKTAVLDLADVCLANFKVMEDVLESNQSNLGSIYLGTLFERFQLVQQIPCVIFPDWWVCDMELDWFGQFLAQTYPHVAVVSSLASGPDKRGAKLAKQTLAAHPSPEVILIPGGISVLISTQV